MERPLDPLRLRQEGGHVMDRLDMMRNKMFGRVIIMAPKDDEEEE